MLSSRIIATSAVFLRAKNGNTSASVLFWAHGSGWPSTGNLVRGSPLLTKGGELVHVKSSQRREDSFTVYNLQVEGHHTYHVSHLGILVHNANYGRTSRRPYAPNCRLPRDSRSGKPIPESPYPHTQAGTKVSTRTGRPYTQAREFGEGGKHVRDIHFTDHGLKDHPDPHQHPIDPVTGKRGRKPIAFP
jgi:pretoxin HINT domain-containing protein